MSAKARQETCLSPTALHFTNMLEAGGSRASRDMSLQRVEGRIRRLRWMPSLFLRQKKASLRSCCSSFIITPWSSQPSLRTLIPDHVVDHSNGQPHLLLLSLVLRHSFSSANQKSQTTMSNYNNVPTVCSHASLGDFDSEQLRVIRENASKAPPPT